MNLRAPTRSRSALVSPLVALAALPIASSSLAGCASAGRSAPGAPETSARAPEVSADATPGRVGGVCSYARTPGVVTVTAIEPPSPGDANCANDPRRVVIRFEGAGTDLVRNGTLTVGAGSNPPGACLAPEGISVGARIPGALARIQSGACTPEIIELARPIPSCAARCF